MPLRIWLGNTGSPLHFGAEAIDLGQSLKLGVGGGTVREIYDTPADLVNILLNNLLIVGGVILFITIIMAGYQFIQSGTQGKDNAREILRVALIGFIMMFSAYWIARIFGVITGIDVIF